MENSEAVTNADAVPGRVLPIKNSAKFDKRVWKFAVIGTMLVSLSIDINRGPSILLFRRGNRKLHATVLTEPAW